MRLTWLFSLLSLHALVFAQSRYEVSSGIEFNTAQQQASAGDTIVWKSGIYYDVRMDVNTDGVTVTAETYGTVLFTGVSRLVINANDVTFSGFQYIGGYIGNLDIIRVYGSDVVITHVNIQNYTCFKYLRVYEASRRTTISYCNFENRLNLDDQNILSILVDNEPGYHKIQHCSFKNFEGIGLDEGIEPIRIGLSSQGNLDSRTLVEYCYFTRCNGDGEIISHKARQNVYRYNTFENNPVAELVLRHGDEGIVYGNFFLNGMGGIRIREGSHHFIYNNYFEDLDKRVIYLMNDSKDPLSDIHIYHNTIIGSEEVRLGGPGSNPPANVTIANNVFANPIGRLFQDDTGNETWIGNYSFGTLGITSPSIGLSNVDPQLNMNIEGFFQPDSNSSVLASASAGYPAIPLFPGMDYDHELALDVMQALRPDSIAKQAIGASEFSSAVSVQPHATEMNTGPSYLFNSPINYVTANTSQLYIDGEGENNSVVISSNVSWTVISSSNWISTNLSSGSGDTELRLTIDPNETNMNRSGSLTIIGDTLTVTIQIFQDPKSTVNVLEELEDDINLFPNPTDGQLNLQNIPSGIYRANVELVDLNGRSLVSGQHRIEDQELTLDLEKLCAGVYLLKVEFIRENGAIYGELRRKLMRN
ncbi:MAG: T9SS type A sorting domain-containing protein [Bacteroidia bacterium]|nr:T9SS type A sorting domain-containing protein [Bacteroidia bacterium]